MNRVFVIMVSLAFTGGDAIAAGGGSVIEKQRDRDQRFSRYSLIVEQYGVVRKNFGIEQMNRDFNSSRFGYSGPSLSVPEVPAHLVDSEGYTDAAFRFRTKIDAYDQLTHKTKTILPMNGLPFAFPGLPTELRLTNATGFEQTLSSGPCFTVDNDHGLLNSRRAFLELCCGFGLTGSIKPEATVAENVRGNGMTECRGSMIIPFLGLGQFVAQIDADDVLRSVVYTKNSWTGSSVVYTITTTGKFRVDNDWIAEQGTLSRQLPLELIDSPGYREPEIDDGYSVRVESMRANLTKSEFDSASQMDRIPSNTFVMDATQGKAIIPLKAGQVIPKPTPGRGWLFTLNLILCAGFMAYLWRRRVSLRASPATKEL